MTPSEHVGLDAYALNGNGYQVNPQAEPQEAEGSFVALAQIFLRQGQAQGEGIPLSRTFRPDAPNPGRSTWGLANLKTS